MAIAHGFGHEVDVKGIEAAQSAEGFAWYCAKYASKAADNRHDVDTLDRRTGEIVRGIPRLRVWTASRRWGLTMLAIRMAQTKWARTEAAGAAEAPASPPGSPVDAEAGDPVDHNTSELRSGCGRGIRS